MKNKLKNVINKLKNKGFTLVELLAVIIVLAIIALIGFTQVGKVIQTSKEKAAVVSAKNYIDAVNVEILNRESAGNPIADDVYNIDELDISFNGTKPDTGTIKIKDSKVVSANLVVNDFGLEYKEESGVVVVSTPIDQENHSYPNGTVVYFNPTTNSKCDDYYSSNSTSGNTAGCLKWFAYLETNDTVNLLLDHNISNYSDFYENFVSTVDYYTSSWNSSLNARMISLDDINRIISKDVSTSTSIESFNWLYVNNSNYWILTNDSSYSTCYAISSSNIVTANCQYDHSGSYDTYNVRPVITVNKSLLK